MAKPKARYRITNEMPKVSHDERERQVAKEERVVAKALACAGMSHVHYKARQRIRHIEAQFVRAERIARTGRDVYNRPAKKPAPSMMAGLRRKREAAYKNLAELEARALKLCPPKK